MCQAMPSHGAEEQLPRRSLDQGKTRLTASVLSFSFLQSGPPFPFLSVSISINSSYSFHTTSCIFLVVFSAVLLQYSCISLNCFQLSTNSVPALTCIAMASDQRSSFSASSNTSHSSSSEIRRPSSFSYQRPSSPSYRLPPLPPSTGSLSSGTSFPAPAPKPSNFAALPPVPPPKDPQMTHPITPKRKPVERQKSPLSNEAYFSSPATIMPGAFPTTPPASSPQQTADYNASAAASNHTPSPASRSPKRPSSVRNFLSFKALRRSHDNASLNSQNDRPISAGGESMTSSLRPSLNKKRSGSFWRRKSSLGMNFGDYSPASPTSPVTKGESVADEDGPRSPAPVEEIQDLPKRKSGTFWRRKSSLNLSSAFAATDGKGNQSPNAGSNGESTATGGNTDGGQNSMTNGRHEGEEDATAEDLDTEKPLPEIVEPLWPRSYSPPPQLPLFVGGGGGLGGEDIFKDIH